MSAVVSAVRSAARRAPVFPRNGGGDRRRAPPFEERSVDDEAFSDPIAPVADRAAASDPELLLLARCAGHIAAAAGAGTVVSAIGAGRQAALLSAALPPSGAASAMARADGADADAPSRVRDAQRPQRRLVYLPRDLVAARGADGLGALLRGAAARHDDDALVVVAVDSAGSLAARAASRSALGCSIARVELLAGTAGWKVCQLWTDGMARHALVVLDRAGRDAAAAKSRVSSAPSIERQTRDRNVSIR